MIVKLPHERISHKPKGLLSNCELIFTNLNLSYSTTVLLTHFIQYYNVSKGWQIFSGFLRNAAMVKIFIVVVVLLECKVTL